MQEWKRLLGRIPKTSYYPIRPVKAAAFTAFEDKHGIKLPQSYREYCSVFGAGRLDGANTIAVPGYGGGGQDDLAAHDRRFHKFFTKFIPQSSIDLNAIKPLLFFASDERRNVYGWHTTEVTRRQSNEMAIYVVLEDLRVVRLADTFRELVRFVMMGSRCTEIGIDRPYRVHTFAAAK